MGKDDDRALPDWLREALDATPTSTPARKIGRPKGARSALTNTHGEQALAVDNSLRDRALEVLCKAMADGKIKTKREFDQAVARIARSVPVDAKTLRADLRQQLDRSQSWSPPFGRDEPRNLFDATQAHIRRAERSASMDEWLAKLAKWKGN